jgi:hypothetical protein
VSVSTPAPNEPPSMQTLSRVTQRAASDVQNVTGSVYRRFADLRFFFATNLFRADLRLGILGVS